MFVVTHPMASILGQVGGTDLERGVWGCAVLKTPFYASPLAHKGPISAIVSSQAHPLLRKNLEFYPLQPQILPKISSLKPPNSQIFSLQVPSFRDNDQFTSPTV